MASTGTILIDAELAGLLFSGGRGDIFQEAGRPAHPVPTSLPSALARKLMQSTLVCLYVHLFPLLSFQLSDL